LRAIDWSRTSLGPFEAWPQSLKSFVSMVIERSREAGFDHHLVKPVALAALRDLLDAAPDAG
jgi:hypothetical protein